MRLVNKEYCFLIKDVFSSLSLVGFTKNSLVGNLPQDIQTALSFSDQQFKVAYLNQIHSEKVLSVDQAGCYEGDGLFTKNSGLVLVVKTADCLPLLFESKELGVIGAVHMGWKSAKAGILDNLPYELSSFKVVAGVGLRKSCYEVGDDFLNHQPFKPFIEKTDARFYFNPVEFARSELIARGLKEDNFIDLDICSLCSKSNFSSCRRGDTSSRTLSFILR
ncbi:MAG: polyphenol oxidase family protein [Candidatus Omnitrophica bacterium]|nr:polyphenol oxidase family protein [Candidatus Omnitrophota bacterium]